jgi:hypothetical protein
LPESACAALVNASGNSELTIMNNIAILSQRNRFMSYLLSHHNL